MAEHGFRAERAAIERRVEPPDFAVVAARGHRIRQRRQRLAAAAAVAAVSATTVGIAVGLGSADRSRGADPVDRPLGPDAAAIIGHRDARVDLDNFAVGADGDILTVVTAPGGPAPAGCTGPAVSAFVWFGGDGGVRAWTDYAMGRAVQAVEGGFVVPAVPVDCRTSGDGPGPFAEDVPYFVDDTGVPRAVRWDRSGPGGAALVERCAVDPQDDRCQYSASEGTARVAFLDEVSYPARAIPVEGPADSERLWARSVDSRRLHWSDDRGATWSSRDTSLGRDDNVTVTLAGEWVAFTTNTRIEFSSDLGETWAVRDLGAALSAFRITDVRWQITSSGNLLGAVGSVGRAERLIRSTDPSWTSFERSDITTSVGLVYVEVAGPFSYVLDDQRWQVSEDDGRTWVTRDPFAELR